MHKHSYMNCRYIFCVVVLQHIHSYVWPYILGTLFLCVVLSLSCTVQFIVHTVHMTLCIPSYIQYIHVFVIYMYFHCLCVYAWYTASHTQWLPTCSLLSLCFLYIQRSLSTFKTLSSVGVLLLPLHIGSNGLNITEATHVILCEPALNPAAEQQAVGRIHRMGQTR